MGQGPAATRRSRSNWSHSNYYYLLPTTATNLQVLEEAIALATEHDPSRHHRHHLARLAQHLLGVGAGVGLGLG